MKKTRNNTGHIKGLLFYIITPIVFSLIIVVVLTVCLTPVLARYSFVADLFYDAGKNISNVDTDAADRPDEITVSDVTEGDVYISEIDHPDILSFCCSDRLTRVKIHSFVQTDKAASDLCFCPQTLPVLDRRHFHALFKYPVKMLHILIANRVCNILNRHVSVF